MNLLFNRQMRVVKRTSSEAATWLAEMGGAPAMPLAKNSPQARQRGDSATSIRAVIAAAFFIVLLAATLLVGGGAAIDPYLRSAMAARDAQGVGDVVVTMPDGKFCRHMSFDNATATMVEGMVEPCKDDITKGSSLPPSTQRGFAWGVR
jgi:hypothetical protein